MRELNAHTVIDRPARYRAYGEAFGKVDLEAGVGWDIPEAFDHGASGGDIADAPDIALSLMMDRDRAQHGNTRRAT